MEELQDAIEDAQYVNAISSQDDGPRPVLAWETPTEEQLAQWKKRICDGPVDETLGDPFGMDWTLSSAIGLFLFSSFLKDDCDDYLRINFVEEVIRWKGLRGRNRISRAKNIISTYLKPPKKDETTGEMILPKKTEIVEYDLARTPPQIGTDDIESFYAANLDALNSQSCVGLKGPVLEEIANIMAQLDESGQAEAAQDPGAALDPGDSTTPGDSMTSDVPPPEQEKAAGSTHTRPTLADSLLLKQISMMNIDRRQTRARKYLSDNLFDRAEAIVMEMLRRQYWDRFQESEQYKKMDKFHWYRDRTVVPEDFFILRVLGRGGFGLVTACKKGTSGKLYAMKVMNKRRIKMKKSEQLALNERAALAAGDSPFVVNLKYSFHSKDDVFLILDLMTGGDLGYHLHQKGLFPKKECLYYAARIMLGLQALHDYGFVYRDLKPENCLLAEDGRVRITDLGLATKITPTLHGAAGTRGYWAPEMLRRDKKGKRMPYGHTVDWFSFGCCLAEFMSGQNPFRSEAALNFGLSKGHKGKEKAIDCATLEMDPEFNPKYFDDDAADLCRLLLEKDETRRLGTKGCEEIMVHPWFSDVNWEMIISDRKKPPFIPLKDVNAASQSEIGNFAEDKAYQETVLEEKDEEVYKDWDWTNPHAFAAEVIEFLIYERETGEPLIPLSQQSPCCCIVL